MGSDGGPVKSRAKQMQLGAIKTETATGASRGRATKKVAPKPPVKCGGGVKFGEPTTAHIDFKLSGDRRAIKKLFQALLAVAESGSLKFHDVGFTLSSSALVGIVDASVKSEAFGTIAVSTTETCR